MGTSTAAGELHSDRVAKLQARKKELEILLAAKNEELYKLCVQEVKLTGVMPPEAPLSPVADRAPIAPDPPAPPDNIPKESHARKSRQIHQQTSDKHKEGDCLPRKQITHRLSTPSISGVSTRSASGQSQSQRTPEYVPATAYSSPDNLPDTYSLHSSQTYPTLQQTVDRTTVRDHRRIYPSADTLPTSYSRHHTITTEQMNKLYYNANNPETRNFSRVHETHFSSSHPDITTQYSHMQTSNEPALQISPGSNNMPLLYQFASQLKARSHHLSGLPQGAPSSNRRKGDSSRRSTLQRTQTYHLTSHSDYNNHLDDLAGVSPQSSNHHIHKHSPMADLQISTPYMRRHQSEQYPMRSSPNYQYSPGSLMQQSPSGSQHAFLNSTTSIYSNQSAEIPDQKVKEKEWYESSLDSPSNTNPGINLSRESYGSLKKPPEHSPSSVQSQIIQDNLNSNYDYNQSASSPISSRGVGSPASPRSQQFPCDVPFESPKNCTVVESGKWIPYREESKPFEMSDFYKYSTKFRQNNSGMQKPKINPPYSTVQMQSEYMQADSGQDHWKHSHQL